MKNVRYDDGYKTSDLNIAASMLLQEGASYAGLEPNIRERVLSSNMEAGTEEVEIKKDYLFKVSGDPDKLEEIKSRWFRGLPVILDAKAFCVKRKFLLEALPRNKSEIITRPIKEK